MHRLLLLALLFLPLDVRAGLYPGNATIANPGIEPLATAQKQRLFIDPIADYGCKFDARLSFDGAAATGSPGIITSASIGFIAADVGKRIVLTGAGAAGVLYVGTVVSLNSGTSVNVTPNISTTVSTEGLQVHTDDLTCWTNIATDVNASVYPGAVIKIEAPIVTTLTSGELWQTASTFTGRSGISAVIPAFTKQVEIIGFGGLTAADSGNYWQVGGACIAYIGGSLWTGFGAVLTFAPVVSSTGPALKAPVLRDFWIDCRNGDALGYQALKGVSLQSCWGWIIDNFFVNDPAAVGVEMAVVGPGNATALGEAKDTTRGWMSNTRFRILDIPTGAITTPFTTTTALTLTAASQNITVAANSLPSTGFIWLETATGYPVLAAYTGGGTTTLGVLISAADAIDNPATISGGNIVEAVPGNASAMNFSGDLTANTCLNHFDTIIVEQGTVWGPAAIEAKDDDSNVFLNVVINGGSAVATNAINRLTKPGVRLDGSNSSAMMSSRNNYFYGGSPGPGGVSVMGLTGASANLLAMASANYWDLQQLGNAEPLPNVEGNTFFGWTTNGTLSPGRVSAKPLIAPQALVAATATIINGSEIGVPPQGWQVGTQLKWTVHMTKTAAGAVAPGTFLILVNTTGTTGSGTIATMALTSVGTAAVDTATVEIDMTVQSLGTGAAGVAHLRMTHGLATGGWFASGVYLQEIEATMATWNSTTAQEFISLQFTSGTGVVPTITQSSLEVIHP